MLKLLQKTFPPEICVVWKAQSSLNLSQVKFLSSMRSVITRTARSNHNNFVRKVSFDQIAPKLFSGYILHTIQPSRYHKPARYTTSNFLQKNMSTEDEVAKAEIAASTDPAVNPNAPTFFDKLVDGSIPADIIYQVCPMSFYVSFHTSYVFIAELILGPHRCGL